MGQERSVARLFRTPPVTHHMLGPLDAQPRQRRTVQRQAKRREPLGERRQAARDGTACLQLRLAGGPARAASPCAAAHPPHRMRTPMPGPCTCHCLHLHPAPPKTPRTPPPPTPLTPGRRGGAAGGAGGPGGRGEAGDGPQHGGDVARAQGCGRQVRRGGALPLGQGARGAGGGRRGKKAGGGRSGSGAEAVRAVPLLLFTCLPTPQARGVRVLDLVRHAAAATAAATMLCYVQPAAARNTVPLPPQGAGAGPGAERGLVCADHGEPVCAVLPRARRPRGARGARSAPAASRAACYSMPFPARAGTAAWCWSRAPFASL